jgi:hypothetical protein
MEMIRMSDAAELLVEARKIRMLLELLAEPAIAARDAKFRDELRKIATSMKMQQSVLLMDGSRTQSQIVAQTSIHKGQLSTLVGKLEATGLLAGGKKQPNLAISIPANFFDANSNANRR